jgi:hypothetical protein
MAENSTIGWTHHTQNFWWGCNKVTRDISSSRLTSMNAGCRARRHVWMVRSFRRFRNAEGRSRRSREDEFGVVGFAANAPAANRAITKSLRHTSPRLVSRPAGGSVLLEALLPGVEGVFGDADERGEVRGGETAPLPGVEDEQALLGCDGRRRASPAASAIFATTDPRRAAARCETTAF